MRVDVTRVVDSVPLCSREGVREEEDGKEPHKKRMKYGATLTRAHMFAVQNMILREGV